MTNLVDRLCILGLVVVAALLMFSCITLEIDVNKLNERINELENQVLVMNLEMEK